MTVYQKQMAVTEAKKSGVDLTQPLTPEVVAKLNGLTREGLVELYQMQKPGLPKSGPQFIDLMTTMSVVLTGRHNITFNQVLSLLH